MNTALRQLVSIASEPIGPVMGPNDTLPSAAGRLRELLTLRNGFFCFDSALHVFPSVTSDASWGLLDWNASTLWKYEYNGMADASFCFAEDIFGHQFAIDLKGSVSTFNSETAEIELLCGSIEEWSQRILRDFDVLTGYSIAHAWQETHGRLPPRFRLMPKQPFVLGGEYSVANLVALDGVRVMQNLGNLARQIHDLPDGTKIRFNITE